MFKKKKKKTIYSLNNGTVNIIQTETVKPRLTYLLNHFVFRVFSYIKGLSISKDY